MQILIPVLAAAGFLHGHGIAQGCVFVLELPNGFLPRLVRVQTQRNTADLRMRLQIGLQCAVIKAAEGQRVRCVPVECEIAHQVDRCLEYENLI